MGILFVPDAFSQGSDTTPPVVTVPSDISSTSTNLSGTAVTFDVTATDNVAVTSGPTCSPASGSNFSVGTTTVTCTATDAAGNVGTASFTITIVEHDEFLIQEYIDNNQIELYASIDEIPVNIVEIHLEGVDHEPQIASEYPIGYNDWERHVRYLAALNWQEHLKPLILELTNPSLMVPELEDRLHDIRDDADDARDQITQSYANGTTTEEYFLASANVEIKERALWYVDEYDDSADEEAEEAIDDWLEFLQEQQEVQQYNQMLLEVLPYFNSIEIQTYDSLDEVPLFSAGDTHFYTAYIQALFYQEHIKSQYLLGLIGLPLDEQLLTIEILDDVLNHQCDIRAPPVASDIPFYNPDGTINDAHTLHDINSDIVCNLDSYLPNTWQMEQGMSLQTVMIPRDEEAEEVISHYLEIEERQVAEGVVTTFLANNPIVVIDQLPETEHFLPGYHSALYWQENTKPFILQNESLVPVLIHALNSEFYQMCDTWAVTSNQIRNDFGEGSVEWEIAKINNDLNCMMNDLPQNVRGSLDQQSLQDAINEADNTAEEWIEEHLHRSNYMKGEPIPLPSNEGEWIPPPEFMPGAEFPCGGTEMLVNGVCVESSTTVITMASGSSTPGCQDPLVTASGCFIPNFVVIPRGGIVSWENNDNAAHTATFGTPTDGPNGIFDSSLIMVSGSVNATFFDAGIYPYFCMVHPWRTGTLVVGDVGPEPEIPSPILNVSVTKNEYDLDEQISLIINLDNTESNATVIVDVLDPAGNAVVTRAATVSLNNSESIQFRIPDNFLTGNYKVVASANIDGNAISDITYFKIKSLYNQFQITSVQVTDQQGDPSTLSKGTLGYVKVTITSDANITALITVNLFDADLTTLGVGSVRSTLSEGESEIILSFLIPSNAASGDAEIFANGFTDWISNGGVPLTGEFSTTEEITQ